MDAVVEMEKPVYERGYLCFVDSQGKASQALVESPEEFDALWAAGWRPSLAAFGIETHPSSPVTVPTLPGDDPAAKQQASLLEQVQGHVLTLQGQVLALAERVLALETRPTAGLAHGLGLAAGPEPEPEPSHEEPSHRRRS